MKNTLIVLLMALSGIASAQTDTTKHTAPDTVTLYLTEWQEKKLQSFDIQKATIEEQRKTLLEAILDMNGRTERDLAGKQIKTGIRPAEPRPTNPAPTKKKN